MQATVRETFRYLLTQYPTLHDCPLDVACTLFCHGSYEWNSQGQLEDRHENKKDPTPKPPQHEPYMQEPYMRSLRIARDLQYQVDLHKYQWTLTNIEDILDCPITTSFYTSEWRGGYYETNPSTYANAINFPDYVNPDWAQAIYKFIGWWLTNLRSNYRVGHNPNTERNHWPKHIEEAYQALLAARKRIYPLAHEGRDYDTDMATQTQLLNKTLKDSATSPADTSPK